MITVSIIVKALNEERHIERCLRSALAALEAGGIDGEVILADSQSTDRTLEIAATLPVRIVQLQHASDRCCGVGAQLGFQLAAGKWVYLLDGDMELDAGFLPEALAALQADPRLAGVAGLVREMHVANLEFQARVARAGTSRPAARLPSLDMGGLYRREAIEPLGYLTNRNLHACEEFELGARLVTQGWHLTRIDVLAVRHYGHDDASLSLLWRRWRSRYALGHGELLRSALGQPHLWFVLARLRSYRIQAILALAWFSVSALGVLGEWRTALAAGLLLPLVAIALMTWRRRSLASGVFAVLSWHVGLAGLIAGFLRSPPASPTAPVVMRVVQ